MISQRFPKSSPEFPKVPHGEQDHCPSVQNSLKKYGAVSEEVALKMAEGVQNNTHADIGVSTTGISGPGGGSEEKPIGLVYIAVVTPNISKVKKYIFRVKRKIHREITTTAALNITRLALEV